MFFRGSRYEPIPEAEIATPAGRTVRYKRVRFIPETRGVLPYTVTQGDRLDRISYRSYGDPEQFWRICDANLSMRPGELMEETGRLILIPVPMS
jgi:nucleoid-associated protein YgaU